MASEYVGGGASDSSINEVSCIGPGATSGTSVNIQQEVSVILVYNEIQESNHQLPQNMLVEGLLTLL